MFKFRTKFPHFLVKESSLKNSHIGTQRKRLDEGNSEVRMKNVTKISKVPKMGHVYLNLQKIPKIKNFSTY